MKKKTKLYIILTLLLWFLAAARIWIPAISDYRDYRAIFAQGNKLDDTIWVVQSDFTRYELTKDETSYIYNAMKQMDNVHIIWETSSETYRMHILGTGFSIQVRFYSDYFRVGKYVCATCDNYSDIFEELRKFIETIPETHDAS